MINKSDNNILYYSYDKDIKNILSVFFENKQDININNYESLLDNYFLIYNKFNKYGIAMNKLNNNKEIEYCDFIYNKFYNSLNDMINKLLCNYDLEEFKNSKYYSLLKNHRNSFINTSEMDNILRKFRLESDLSFDNLIKYISSRNKVIYQNKFNSFFEYILNNLGLTDIFCENVLKINKESSLDDLYLNEEYLYDLEEAKKIVIECLKDNYDEKVLNILLDSTYISNDRSGTTVAYGEVPIINIEKEKDNKIDIIVLSHEIGHAYHYYCNQSNTIENFDSRSDFSESFAISTQFIVANELNLEKSCLRDFDNFFYDTIYSINIQKFIDENYKNIKEDDLINKFNDYKKYIRYVLDNFYDLYYLEGFIVGMLLSKKIKNYSVEELKNMLSFDSNIPLNDILKIFDIDLNDVEQLNCILEDIKIKYLKIKGKNSKRL